MRVACRDVAKRPQNKRRPGSRQPGTPGGGRDATPSGGPRRRGFDPAQPFQVGRRPSSPLLLMVVGLMWVAAGVIALFAMTASWRLVPAIAFVGVGLYFVRGASATVLRRDRRSQR